MTPVIPTPTHDNIVVIEDPIETVSTGGIILPDAFTITGENGSVSRHDRVDRNLRSGTVVAVGPGRMYADFSRKPLDILVGDKILFERMSGIGVSYEDNSYLVMSEKNVIAILEEGE